MKPSEPNFRKAKKEIKRTIKKVVGNVKKVSAKDVFKNKKGKVFSCVREIKETNSLVIVRLKGSIDAYTIPKIETKHGSEIEKNLDKHILLDFKEVSHIDSATLASLVLLLNELKVHHRKLGIVNPTPLLMNYININKLKSKVRIYKNGQNSFEEFVIKQEAL